MARRAVVARAAPATSYLRKATTKIPLTLQYFEALPSQRAARRGTRAPPAARSRPGRLRTGTNRASCLLGTAYVTGSAQSLFQMVKKPTAGLTGVSMDLDSTLSADSSAAAFLLSCGAGPSAQTFPPRFLPNSPPSGCPSDFRAQFAEHARHTTERGSGCPLPLVGCFR